VLWIWPCSQYGTVTAAFPRPSYPISHALTNPWPHGYDNRTLQKVRVEREAATSRSTLTINVRTRRSRKSSRCHDHAPDRSLCAPAYPCWAATPLAAALLVGRLFDLLGISPAVVALVLLAFGSASGRGRAFGPRWGAAHSVNNRRRPVHHRAAHHL
jgi:hypothetical protein